MTSRRLFLKDCSLGALGLSLQSKEYPSHPLTPEENWYMPAESTRHTATWMAYPSATQISGKKLLEPQQNAILAVAHAISTYEPVNLLVCPREINKIKKKISTQINLYEQEIDDMWIRDTGPLFVTNRQHAKAGIDFNFNGWGNKQSFAYDRKVAHFITRQTGAHILASKIVLEGGAIEVDGQGSALITTSSVLNPNRNPGVNQATCEAELKRLLGIRKVIWLPGITGHDITDGHVDLYVRFVQPGLVVASYEADPSCYEHAVTKNHLAILQTATDANHQPLKLIVLEGPRQIRSAFQCRNFAASYLNFYLTNDAIFLPEFGDKKADANAKSRLNALFPGRTPIQLNIDPIAAGGGGIHCITQQEPDLTTSSVMTAQQLGG